jgi:hypothetical protein
VTGIGEWLQELGLEKYASVFAEHEITLEVLPDLTEADIDRLGLPIGAARLDRLGASAAGQILGVAQLDHACTTIGRTRRARRCARTACADLQLFHRRLRHARPPRRPPVVGVSALTAIVRLRTRSRGAVHVWPLR